MTVKSKWVLPDVVDPPDHLCVLVPVPNNKYHIAAFLGAIYELTRWYSWQDDNLQTGLAVGKVWQKIFLDLKVQLCADFECAVPIEEWIDEMSLCDNIRFLNGKLQVLCCGTWVDVTGQPAQGIGGGSQPGPGSPIPPAGACQDYSGQLSGSGQWYLPYAVNSGDTIAIDETNGAWSDPTINAQWYCPDGNQFFLGACIPGTTHLVGTDPLPSSPHMSLIALISGVYYPAAAGTITVPGGISNAEVVFLANDSTPAGNSGSVTFKLTVCNHAVGQFTHHFDFRISTYGFFLYTAGGTLAVWTAGIGFHVTSGGAANDNIVNIRKLNAAPLAHASIRLVGSRSAATLAGSQVAGLNAANTMVIETHPTSTAAGPLDTGFVPFAATIFTPDGDCNAGNTAGDTSSITDFYVQADGVDPF